MTEKKNITREEVTFQLKFAVPNGADGYKLPFSEDNYKNITCPHDCIFNHFIPTKGNGIISYSEKYTGWQYCVKFHMKLERVRGGTDTCFMIKGCDMISAEEIMLNEKIQLTTDQIVQKQQELEKLRIKLTEIKEEINEVKIR